MQTEERSGWGVCGLVLVVALAVNLAAGVASGLRRPMTSDAHYYLNIAQSLAAGQGYVLRDGFWPQAPTMTRSPAWPCTVALLLRALPSVSPDLLMRGLCLLLNAVVALLLARLGWVLLRVRWAAALAGLAYALHPEALYLATGGGSEILFLALTAGGTLLMLHGDWRRWLGILCLGLACLARANFVLWVLFAAAGVVLRAWLTREPSLRRWLLQGALAAALFLLPSGLWAARNYTVCRHFPVLSTLRGQTFYGGNNAVVADELDNWGYWIFPNSIPGEQTMLDMSRTMSEYEVDEYYFRRGAAYVKRHAFGLPRLLLGKLIRAYVPVPWKPNWGTYAIGLIRLLIYLGAAAGGLALWRRLHPVFRVTLAAMAATNVATVLMFWGCARFAFALEPFLLPLFAAGVSGWLFPRSAIGATAEARGGTDSSVGPIADRA